jgi:hypothetical protein
MVGKSSICTSSASWGIESARALTTDGPWSDLVEIAGGDAGCAIVSEDCAADNDKDGTTALTLLPDSGLLVVFFA